MADIGSAGSTVDPHSMAAAVEVMDDSQPGLLQVGAADPQLAMGPSTTMGHHPDLAGHNKDSIIKYACLINVGTGTAVYQLGNASSCTITKDKDVELG